jgi:hypothetical protein
VALHHINPFLKKKKKKKKKKFEIGQIHLAQKLFPHSLKSDFPPKPSIPINSFCNTPVPYWEDEE